MTAPVQCLAFDGIDAHCDRMPSHDGEHRERRPSGDITWKRARA